MAITTDSETIERRIAALPKKARATTTLVMIMRQHEFASGTDLSWTGDPDQPPRCGSALANDIEPDNAFFPRHHGDKLWMRTRERYCRHCPIAAACYEHGLKNEYPGLWGGELITPRFIAAMRRARLARERRGEQRIDEDGDRTIA